MYTSTLWQPVMGPTRRDWTLPIGPPWQRVYFGNLRQTAWDYRYRDSWGYVAVLSVMVDDAGLVASRVTQRIERDNRR